MLTYPPDTPILWLICLLACSVAFFTQVPNASRSCAIITKQVATALTISQLFLIATRLSNFLYYPIIANHIDDWQKAELPQAVLLSHMQWILLFQALGAALGWLFYDSLVEFYTRASHSIFYRGSMVAALKNGLHPRTWPKLISCLRPPTLALHSLTKLSLIPKDFLVFNFISALIWSVGGLSALYASALLPDYRDTAILLSGLINAVAAISFSFFVEPTASRLTDQAVSEELDPEAVHSANRVLMLGNFIGYLFSMGIFATATQIILSATKWLQSSSDLSYQLWPLLLGIAVFTLLSTTVYAARIAAVTTSKVASAMAIYGLVFLVTRLTQQAYAPFLGALKSNVDHSREVYGLDWLSTQFSWILWGATGGAVLGILLQPTFVKFYEKATLALQKHETLTSVILHSLAPKNWYHWLAIWTPPSLFGLSLKEVFAKTPKTLIFGALTVFSILNVSTMSSLYASALSIEPNRTATLLSGIINGFATIANAIIVDPTMSLFTDQAIKDPDKKDRLLACASCLVILMPLATLLSQILLKPAGHAIYWASQLIDYLI